MIGRIAVAVLLLCPFASGCGLFSIGARNLYNEAKLVRDSRFEEIRYACLAHQAWERVKASCPPQTYSADYAAGFHAGFADYLYAGGCGEPPGIPPKRYRHFHAESPQGAKALQDWYAGFRHGAAVAKESGLRQFVLVPLPPPVVPQPHPPLVPSGIPSFVPAADPSAEAPSQLSTPRKVPSETSYLRVEPRWLVLPTLPKSPSETPSEAEGTPEAPWNEEPRPSSGDADSSEGSANQGPRIDEARERPPAPEEQS